jgi:hypothetical protein
MLCQVESVGLRRRLSESHTVKLSDRVVERVIYPGIERTFTTTQLLEAASETEVALRGRC